MAILRLTNGSDITVKLSVADLKAAISTLMSPEDFIELPGDVDRPPALAVLDLQGDRPRVHVCFLGTTVDPPRV